MPFFCAHCSRRRAVVPACACQGHASSLDRTHDPDDVVRPQVLPLLRVQYSWRHRRGRCVYAIFTVCWHAYESYVGTGAVYSFDPVGSYERETCRAAGSAQSLVQPFLDNQVRAVAWVEANAKLA